MKRFGQLLMVALFATMIWTPSASAAPVWYFNCQVDSADLPVPNTFIVRITDNDPGKAFTNLNIAAVRETAPAMLAVALTAMSIGNKVWCQVDLDVTPIRLVRLMMSKDPLP